MVHFVPHIGAGSVYTLPACLVYFLFIYKTFRRPELPPADSIYQQSSVVLLFLTATCKTWTEKCDIVVMYCAYTRVVARTLLLQDITLILFIYS